MMTDDPLHLLARITETFALDLWDWVTDRVFEWGLIWWTWGAAKWGWVWRRNRRR